MERKREFPDGDRIASDRKKRLWLIILLAVVFFILLLIGIVFLKLNGMRKNAVGIVPKPNGNSEIKAPEATLIPVLDEDELDLTQDYEIEADPGELTDDPIFAVNPKDPNVMNILMLGSDSRGTDRGRTDSIILISYNKSTRQAKMVSFLRDSWVYIPGKDIWNRINTSYFFGGVGMLVNTLNTNFDLDIQYYMKV